MNIFNKLIISDDYIKYFPNQRFELYIYLDDKLNYENLCLFQFDLKNALTINANGEYI
jgi:hypothetical protein